MSGRFAGKSVFITGASSGIGAELALAFAREGARVGLAARRLERLEEVKARVEALGGTAVTVACDVTQRASVDAAVARVAEAFGGIDVAVANAGFGVGGLFVQVDTDGFRRQFDTNVFGVIDNDPRGVAAPDSEQGAPRNRRERARAVGLAGDGRLLRQQVCACRFGGDALLRTRGRRA